VRSDAKASSAGSTEGSGSGLLRRAFAIRGASSDAKGSGARSYRLLSRAVLLVGLFTLCSSASAQAASKWFNTGEFAHEALSSPSDIAVDDSSGNVYVTDSGTNRVQVFDPSGVAATPLASFGEGALARPFGIAIDQSNGDAYISSQAADETQAVQILNASGGTFTLTFDGQTTGPLAYEGGPEEAQDALEGLSSVAAGDVEVQGTLDYRVIVFKGTLGRTDVASISVDDSDLVAAVPDAGPAVGSVETVRQGTPGKIFKFVPDNRASPTSFSEALSFTSPVEGSNAAAGEIGSFASALAVDPSNGDLLVADAGNLRVSRFTSIGAFVGSFTGAGSEAGVFTSLWDIAVDATGSSYVVANGTLDPAQQSVSGARVERFTQNGVAGGALDAPGTLERARSVAVDPDSGDVLVVTGGSFLDGPATLNQFHNGKVIFSVQYSSTLLLTAGLAANGGSPERAYSLTIPGFDIFQGPYGFSSVQVFEPKFVPEPSLDLPSTVTIEGAHLSGTINVGGEAEVHYHFEYFDGAAWISTADKAIEGTPAGSVPVGADITGLLPSGEYQVRLVASSKFEEATSQVLAFTTTPVLPEVVTGAAADRTATGATLLGSVNPNGAQTTYRFEYGPTTTYGSRIPVGNEAVSGRARAPLSVSQSVSGLEAGTTYHYRLVGKNAAGTELGEDKTLKTLAAVDAVARAYELVSPAEKEGNNVQDHFGYQASEDGDSIAFLGLTSLGDFTEDTPLFPRHVAFRDASGWTTKGADAAQIHSSAPGTTFSPLQETFGVSADGTKAVTMSLKKLASGAVEGDSNIYLHDLVTGAYTTMATTPGSGWWQQLTGGVIGSTPAPFVQGTPNFDHVLLLAAGGGAAPPQVSLLPGAPNSALYEFTDGELHLASVDPSGAPVPAGVVVFKESHGVNVISRDGSRIAFLATDGVNAAMIRSGGVTKAMSESQRSSDPPGTLRDSALLGGDQDLKVVYFFSHDLTDSSTSGVRTLYRYDTGNEELDALAEAPAAQGLQVSADGSSVYFASTATLLPGAVADQMNLYVWRGENLSLAGSVAQPSGISWWASPNGRYFAYRSLGPHAAGNPACGDFNGSILFACLEIFRYDADTGQTVCVSCRADGRVSGRSVYMGWVPSSDSGVFAFARAVNNQGQVFFESGEQLVAKDTNSASDVYEYSDVTGLRLISTGTGKGSFFADVSADGRDVFFATGDRLVRADFDNSTDLYDARVGGGIPSQNTVPPSACNGEDCRGQAIAPPAPPPGGSETTVGPGNQSARRHVRCFKGRYKQKIRGRKRCVQQQKGKNRANSDQRQGK
jgi:DNA-binding beta-propeller fold protein YncE